MTAYTAYFNAESGNYYAKPRPITSPHAGDVITCTPGNAGEYSFTADSETQYVVYRRATGTPLSTDEDECEIGKNLNLDIVAKTNLIGRNDTVFGGSPVASNGSIAEIIIGDDYLTANSRNFYWDVPAPSGLSIGDCTCWFGGEAIGDHVGSWMKQGTLTDQTGGVWRASFQLVESDTIDCEPGLYNWSAAVHGPSAKITKVRSRTTKTLLVVKQTA